MSRIRLLTGGVALALAVGAGGCAGSDSPVDATAPALPAVTEVADGGGFADDLDIEDVVAAALLIASGGDLEAAISAGLVGEREAEAALDALERGNLDRILGG